MGNRAFLALLISASIALCGCAQGISTRFSAIPLAPPDGPVRAVLSRGQIVALQSQADTVSVYLEYGQIQAGMAADIFVGVTNEGDAPLTFDFSDVRVAAGDRPLALVDQAELLKSVKGAYADDEGFQTLMAGWREWAAAQRAGTHTITGTTLYQNRAGMIVGSSQTQHVIVNEEAALAAGRRQQKKDETRLGEFRAHEVDKIDRVVAARPGPMTVAPGDTVIGMVRTRPDPAAEKAGQLSVTVQVEGDPYPFTYRVTANRLASGS